MWLPIKMPASVTIGRWLLSEFARTASVLGFAHTVGEFGVVLMVGGNIPGQTRVLSVAIYDHVEAGEFSEAHRLSAGMVVFALVVLVTLYVVNRPPRDDAERAR